MAIKDFGKLNGPEKAAIMMFAMGDEYAAKVFDMLEDDEIRELSQAMATLGSVDARIVERLFVDFAGQMSAGGTVVGTLQATHRLLSKVMTPDQVEAIMQDISGPSGRTVWEKLGNVSDSVLANYLKNEYPQTVAVCLSRIKADQAARVLTLLPESLSRDVVVRMLKMDTVSREVLDDVEQTLRTEFMATLSRTQRRDPHENMAEILNNLDRANLNRLMTTIEELAPEGAEKVKSLMFTFEDLMKLTPQDIQAVLREVDKDALGIALKGATEDQRRMFFQAMSERAVKLLQEEIASMGPVRIRDVYDAQGRIVNTTKDLINRGVIEIADDDEGSEMIE
jgi:flagellar motor switch protein FliG